MRKTAAFLCAIFILTALSGAAAPVEAAKEGLSGIMILSLPESGKLTLDGRELKPGQAVLAEDLSKIKYIPESRTEQYFSYVEADSQGHAGRIVTAALPQDYNSAPRAGNGSLKTWAGLSSGGMLRAGDDDGDSLEYRLLSAPEKGRVLIENGKFTYTPYNGRHGDDSFTYIVRDEYGAWSEEARVDVEIMRRQSPVDYADMEGNAAQYAAARLAKEGIFTGASVAGVSRFMPDALVSRGEFAAMALCAAGIEPDLCVSTDFDDDASIPLWQRGYISAAMSRGLLAGYYGEDGRILCRAGDDINVGSAAAIIERLFGGESEGADWAGAAMAGLDTRGMLGMAAGRGPESMLTRADAAMLLCAVLDHIEDKAALGLFSWTEA